VTGDLKLDPPDAPRAIAPDLAVWLGGAPLVVAGSTHAGEEEALLAAQQVWEREGQRPVLVLAPRYPQRAGEDAALARRSGRRAALRSERATALLPGDVGVLDTLGELPALYAHAAIAFVGGTLVPVGGHNVLEPVSAGTSVVYGPHVANVHHAVELLEAVGAGQRVPDAATLGATIANTLARVDTLHMRGAVGRAALQAHRGSSERSADLVERALRAARGGV
jgi:3-deoxy-D-manno-octulosonic-acid transferase